MKKIKAISAIAAAALAVSAFSAVSVSAEETYHAYIGIQSASYSFRNAWNEGSYGKGIVGDDGTEYFNQITGWDGPTAVSKGGVFTDAEITADGTYSVKVTDFDFGEDESLNLLFVSTDIPAGSCNVSDVKVIMDGQTKYTFDDAYLSPDEQTYVQPMAINIWNDDLGKQEGLFGYVMPSDSIEIQFTVSGLPAAAEAPAEEAAPVAEEAPAAEATTTAPATGNASAAALAGVMAVAAAAVAVSKRK